ncbi:hypothetical protein ACKI1V_43820, partial [Streptomyces scabiei]
MTEQALVLDDRVVAADAPVETAPLEIANPTALSGASMAALAATLALAACGDGGSGGGATGGSPTPTPSTPTPT